MEGDPHDPRLSPEWPVDPVAAALEEGLRAIADAISGPLTRALTDGLYNLYEVKKRGY